ncbi:hypothetical protein D3C86_463880 [compost metagenome]
MPHLGGGAHRALAAAARQALLDGHGRRNAVHRVHLGPARGLHDAARIGVERFEVAALAFVEKNVERERRLARAAHARHHAELAARNVHAEVLQVVLARIDDLDGVAAGRRLRVGDVAPRGALGHLVGARADGEFVVGQRRAGERGAVLAQLLGRALGHHLAAGVAAFGAEVDEPVAGADHVEVVLDDDQRMARVEQLAQRAHEPRDVVEVQAGGRLVEQEQRALARHHLAARGRALGRFGQEARELQALRLAARERGHGLAELHVVQAHVDDGLQHAQHVAVGVEQRRGLGHGEFQDVGHVVALGLALDLHFEDLGPVALAVAVGAAQVHVRQELHLDVLEARAAAGRATPVAGIEAELARGVAALARQRRGGEDFADGVPRAHVARGVGARGLADGRLVDEHHVAQVIGAEHAVVRARRLGGLAEVAHERGRQHVLDERRFARAAHAGHAHEARERKVDRDVLQVVLAHAFEDEPVRVLAHEPLEAHADLLAPAQVLAGERVGVAQLVGAAVEHDLPAARAGAGAHVDHAVGREHHGRVVLDHHQRVAGIAQAQHGLGDAVHVARMQADAGLVEHEQRVHQRGAQRRREVDALHLAAAERAALAVEREVADAHVVQVAQARGDLFEQQLQRLRLAFAGGAAVAVVLHAVEELAQPLDGQQHQVVQAQAGQRLELRAAPLRAGGQEALFRRQHGVGVVLAADAPQQRVELQARAAANRARRVAAVLRQEHADVHLVGLALQVAEEAAHAVPLLVPVAVLVVGRALDHPVLLLLGELVPRRVARNAGGLGVAHEVVLRLFPRGRLDGLDGAGAQRELVVRDHEPQVDADHAAEAAAGVAGAHRRVEREHRRDGVGVADVALGAVQAGGELPHVGRCVFLGAGRMHGHAPAAALERHLDRFDHARALRARDAEAVGHHVEHLARAGGRGHLALGLHAREAAGRQPLRHFVRRGAGRQLDREGDDDARIARGRRALGDLRIDAVGRVVAHRQRGLAVEQLGRARVEQLQVVVQLGHRADRGARGAHRVGLVDGDGGRHALHLVDGGLVHAVQELARVGGKGLHVAALAFGVEGVEHEARLARAAGPGDHGHLAGADVEVEVLEVVLARAANPDGALCHECLGGWGKHSRECFVTLRPTPAHGRRPRRGLSGCVQRHFMKQMRHLFSQLFSESPEGSERLS